MANIIKNEIFENAIIDVDDMTITEYKKDDIRTYSLIEFLKRWNGVPNITLSVRRIESLPPDGRDDV